MGALGETAGFIAFTYFFLKLWDEDDEDEPATQPSDNAAIAKGS
jgi:hypothetical protein